MLAPRECRNVERPVMDFTLSPEIEDIRVRTRRFVEEHVLPLEADAANYDDHENIRLDVLRAVQAKARAEGLWAPQAPKEYGGLALADRRLGGDVRGGQPLDLRPGMR